MSVLRAMLAFMRTRFPAPGRTLPGAVGQQCRSPQPGAPTCLVWGGDR
ncbi:hypothetical protein [Nocardiopsis synnemataformans]